MFCRSLTLTFASPGELVEAPRGLALPGLAAPGEDVIANAPATPPLAEPGRADVPPMPPLLFVPTIAPPSLLFVDIIPVVSTMVSAGRIEGARHTHFLASHRLGCLCGCRLVFRTF